MREKSLTDGGATLTAPGSARDGSVPSAHDASVPRGASSTAPAVKVGAAPIAGSAAH
jgi:hypothetical protein